MGILRRKRTENEIAVNGEMNDMIFENIFFFPHEQEQDLRVSQLFNTQQQQEARASEVMIYINK